MGAYVRRRLFSLVVVTLIASIVIFSLVRFMPGTPAYAIAGATATPEQITAITQRLGLDRNVVTQYLIWLGRMVHGDFGDSYIYSQPVGRLISERWSATLQLAIGGLIAGFIFGLVAGVIGGLRPDGLADRAISALSVVALGVPAFSLGMAFLLIFGLKLHWFPLSGFVSVFDDPWQALLHLLLPSVTLGFVLMPQIALLVRDGIVANLEQDHVRTATAMGLHRGTIVRRNLLRNAFTSVLTMLGLITGNLLSGTVIVETVFTWPGLGRLAVDSVSNADFPTVQAVVLLAVATFVIVNLATDLLHARLDPRVLKGGR
jgi:peptide/nickel transport system permease protein